MKCISTIILTAALVAVTVRSEKHEDADKDSEKKLIDSFKSAFSNRSEELGDFFNRTFGAGGNSSEVADRFLSAWQGASEGVKRFVNETYWNLTRMVSSNDTDEKSNSGKGFSLEDVSAKISNYWHALHFPGAGTTPEAKDKKSEDISESTLDTAWSYFKNVFGVHSSNKTKEEAEPTAAEVPPSSVIPHTTTSGVFVAFITILAAVFLFYQTAANRNSLVNKSVHNPPTAHPVSRAKEVSNGYVRLM